MKKEHLPRNECRHILIQLLNQPLFSAREILYAERQGGRKPTEGQLSTTSGNESRKHSVEKQTKKSVAFFPTFSTTRASGLAETYICTSCCVGWAGILVLFSCRFQECCFWQLDDREGRKELQLSLFDVLTLQDPGEGKLGCWGCWAVGGPAVLSYIHVPHIASKLMIRQKRDRIAEEEEI